MKYNADQYEENYPPGFETSYWNRARNRTLRKALRAAGAQRILDIGCGLGPVVADMRKAGLEAWGVELGDPPVLASARPWVTTGTDVVELPLSQRESIDTITLLDVIEHIEDVDTFLKKVAEAFPKLSNVVVTVPARQELWSNFDEFYGHFRRYSLPQLADQLSRAWPGLEIADLRYFFRIFYLPALVSRLVAGGRETKIPTPKYPLLEETIARFSLATDRLLPGSIPGSSALCVARVGTR